MSLIASGMLVLAGHGLDDSHQPARIVRIGLIQVAEYLPPRGW